MSSFEDGSYASWQKASSSRTRSKPRGAGVRPEVQELEPGRAQCERPWSRSREVSRWGLAMLHERYIRPARILAVTSSRDLGL